MKTAALFALFILLILAVVGVHAYGFVRRQGLGGVYIPAAGACLAPGVIL